MDTSLITSTFINGEVSITAFASGADLPVGIAFRGTSLLFLLQQQLHESHLNYLQKGKKNMIQLSCLGTKGIFDIFTICSQNP